jgi:hypothetical protein
MERGTEKEREIDGGKSKRIEEVVMIGIDEVVMVIGIEEERDDWERWYSDGGKSEGLKKSVMMGNDGILMEARAKDRRRA